VNNTRIIRKPAPERFFNKVEVIPFHSCWEWIAAKNPAGYGVFRDEGKGYLAHRWSWLFHFKSLPTNKLVCHKCDNPGCVRPEHLFLGTSFDNVKDMIQKGRQNITGLSGSNGKPPINKKYFTPEARRASLKILYKQASDRFHAKKRALKLKEKDDN
jgi:HNH endonuclease